MGMKISNVGAEKLVEYRTVRHSSLSEASCYLTNAKAKVGLRFNNPLVCAMKTGRKLMRVGGSEKFEFLSGEILLVNSSTALEIEFPDASEECPVECMVIEFDRQELTRIVERINESMDSNGHNEHMELDWLNFAHLRSAPDVQQQMRRVMDCYDNEHGIFRDALIESAHRELVMRILQAQSFELLKKRGGADQDTGLQAAIRAIVEKPSHRFSSEELAMIAGMSEASIFRHFKTRYGVSPAKFAMARRVDCARKMLSGSPISEVSYALGFSDVGHFSKVFREIVGENPGEFQKRRRATHLMHYQ